MPNLLTQSLFAAFNFTLIPVFLVWAGVLAIYVTWIGRGFGGLFQIRRKKSFRFFIYFSKFLNEFDSIKLIEANRNSYIQLLLILRRHSL